MLGHALLSRAHRRHPPILLPVLPLAARRPGCCPPQLPEEVRPFFCLDLSYAHMLLTKGFKLNEESTITLVKKVEYNGDAVEAAWPLGAAINTL